MSEKQLEPTDLPDYTQCSLEQLYDVRRRIDADSYPTRAALLHEEISRRELAFRQTPTERAPTEKPDVRARDLPPSLLILAALYVVMGVTGVFELVNVLRGGTRELSLGIIGLLIGPGLVYRAPVARTAALFLCWLGFIAGTVLLFITLFWLFMWRIILVLVVALAFTFWQYHVLTRQDVRRLFGIV
jgi:hypothetical protein